MTTTTIVVGAGSAGAVVATRLTESENHRVLLVEAGPDYPEPSALPHDLADGTRNSLSRHDWGLRHRPNEKQMWLPMPRGRVVGGSSAVNTCIALRGDPADYDEWADLGLAEWSWEACLPAFRRLERDLDYAAHALHGADGPLPVRRHPPEEWVPWQAAFVEGCRELGIPACDDFNRPGAVGIGAHAMNKIEGRRISAAEAWLTPAVRARENLEILPETHVRRVLFDGRRACGVEVERGRGGAVERLEADRVVLSAGAIFTPGILLRSGIGPRDQVEGLGVELIAHNPGVGSRLLDHPGCAIFFVPRWHVMGRKQPLIQTVYRYASDPSGHPCDMQIQPGSCVPTPWIDLPLVSIMAPLGKPLGTGKLTWSSADPHARPLVQSALLDDPRDRAVACDAMRRAWEISQTSAMRDLAWPFWPRPRTLNDTTRMDRWIRKATDSGYHPSGTVPMGTSQEDAATDGRGRVYGVDGLFVADASLFPTIPSANTNLPTLMIGERMGSWLREET